jgi:phenylalanyl-tRNA synthetase alpha chain
MTYMQEKLQNIKNEALAQIISATGPDDLERIRILYLGKNGQLNDIAKSFKDLNPDEKAELGRLFNDVKTAITSALSTSKLTSNISNLSSEFDPTLPGIRPIIGLLHPISVVAAEMNSIFQSLGFSVADGPEIETDEFNYNRLNLPKDHPARDLQDSLYIKEPDILLRTQNSSVEAHIMQDCKPPYRFVFPGKCYRYENVSASNHMLFYQYQGVAVDTTITMANLKSTLETFIRIFFGPGRKSRFRCKYYPEVEPGVGVDIDCQFCHQKGCPVCKYRGWIEMLGAGMIHPNMFRKVNLDPAKYSGFAWGMGLDRIVMSRYSLNDIRALYNGDLVYKI